MSKLGIIYKCVSPEGKIYIGQHGDPNLYKRIQSHRGNYFEFLKRRCILELKKKFNPKEKISITPKGFCTALYHAFMKHGFYNFKWFTILKNVKSENINEREDKYINKFNSLVPNGYNLKTNKAFGDNQSFSTETIKRMSDGHKKSMKENLYKYRKNHEELKNVPQHVTFFESGGIRGYRIHNHPKCKSKQFADSDTPVETLKKQMLNFLKQCEQNPYQTIQQRKKDRGIPKGMTEQKPGRFLVQFAYKGTRYVKFFSNGTREEALHSATEWMENKKKELITQEYYDSDEYPNLKEYIKYTK